ncbi:type IV secretory system conjugative DNA transfer family protein [Micromonospora sp. NPDC048871]|uniref:type IV secretory system conjugative DNA transfer family protein n=1 Tax=unclassified Micromonospora TaxID=2617518 RepID=UPI002E121F49|nr:type IV secretory system conjugative DNA transfer family protein [Micromonospora sp. NBC_01739]
MSEVGREALLLGQVVPPSRNGATPATSSASGLLTYDENAHLLTIASNRSGRCQSCLIPNLLTYPGQVVAVDLTGEAYAATAAARRAMGHTVVRLDPFEVAGPESDALDPMTLLDGLPSPALESGCQDLAELLVPGNSPGSGIEQSAFGLLSAVIGYLTAVPDRRSFDQVYVTMHSDDVIYNLAVVLDTIGKKIPKMSYSEIADFLQREDVTRSRILTHLTSHLKTFANPQVQGSVSRSSFSLSEMRAGAPVTVYLMVPPERLATHAPLLRVWVGTLLHNALKASRAGVPPTLFLLDHCAELGPFPLLEAVLRLRSGSAVRAWTFWHDLHQLRTTYPSRWPEIVAGSGVVQVFGSRETAAASEAEALLGLAPTDVWSLGPGEQFVRLDGTLHRARRLDAQNPLSSKIAR